MQDAIAGRGSYEPRPHRLGIIRCDHGSMAITDGEYDNFTYPLVWSLDGEWIVFSAPFQPRGLWLTRAAEPRLERVKFSRNAPAPLCDVSDLIP